MTLEFEIYIYVYAYIPIIQHSPAEVDPSDSPFIFWWSQGGIVTRVYTMSPKKPNSAIRKARPTGSPGPGAAGAANGDG